MPLVSYPGAPDVGWGMDEGVHEGVDGKDGVPTLKRVSGFWNYRRGKKTRSQSTVVERERGHNGLTGEIELERGGDVRV